MRQRIPADQNRPGIDSEDLFRLGQLLSQRLFVTCSQCRNHLQLTVESGGLKIGSSPDMTGIDASQPGRPRLVFWCSTCMRTMGFVQGDAWTARTADDLTEQTRWNHLEIENQ